MNEIQTESEQQVFSTTSHKDQLLRMQYSIARTLAEANSITGAAPQVIKLICETAGWEYGALWQVDVGEATLTNKGVWHVDAPFLAKYAEEIRFSIVTTDEATLPGQVYQQGKSLWLPDLELFHSTYALDAQETGLRCGYILPVRTGNGVVAILECLSFRSQTKDKLLNGEIQIKSLTINLAAHRAFLDGADLHLTRTEYALLVELAKNQEAVLTHENILTRAWGPEYRDSNHYLHIYLGRIRKKLGEEMGPYLETVPGIGYIMHSTIPVERADR